MRRFSLLLLTCVAIDWLAAPAVARAQTDLSGCRGLYQALSLKLTVVDEIVDGKADKHTTLEGTPDHPVQIDCDEMQFFADHVEVYRSAGRVTAHGNVLFVSSGNRISAERMDFNTNTRTGIFYIASGTTTLRDKADPGLFGGQEPDAYFYGEQLHKLGPKKYKIVRGGFTTCVQPTPRWEIVSGSVTMNLDDYALMKNSVLKVKGVPLMYLPIFYYPIQEDDRATGFLIPSYGSSTIRGQTISNAFFWAIGRSNDATLYFDWFSKTGKGYGGEYRYVAGPSSSGNARAYVIDEHGTTYVNSSGTTSSTDAGKSYDFTGNMSQRIPGRLQARGHVNYFSSVVSLQRYQQNLYQATNRTRGYGASLTGNWGAYSLSATADRIDTFYGDTQLVTNGAVPRLFFARGERPIGRTPIYFGVTTEFARALRGVTINGQKQDQRGLSRVDLTPTVRVPFKAWPFLTVNSAVTWRGTYWTESLVGRVQVAEPISRKYFDFQSRITGPVFNRVWNPPDGGTKIKHVIEPTFSVQRVTAIDNFDRIVQILSGDYVIGNVTRFGYGLTNRIYAKKDVSREILSATVSQSYYTDANATQYDRQYQSSFSGTPPTHYTPVSLVVRGAPTTRLQADFRTEWDPTVHTLRTFGGNASFNLENLQLSGGWSARRFIKELRGFDNEDRATNYVNATTTVRGLGNRVGGSYNFIYDLRRDHFMQQRIVAFYNSQCCGIAFEYQSYNLTGSLVHIAIPQDQRFNLSFTLAGIGTFSNLLGSFGGGQGR
jgi:LPS-assembly protein